jgi:hypothetical protein
MPQLSRQDVSGGSYRVGLCTAAVSLVLFKLFAAGACVAAESAVVARPAQDARLAVVLPQSTKKLSWCVCAVKYADICRGL